MSALLRAGCFVCTALLLPLYSQTSHGVLPRPLGNGLSAATPVRPITYHGGPVLLGPTNVYLIFYGNWATDPGGKTILRKFVSSFGGSPHFAINSTYYDVSGKFIGSVLNLAGETTDNYSQGPVIGQSAAVRIITTATATIGGTLPKDPNGIYVVMTSDDVIETSGFCGYHDYATLDDVIYAVVGRKKPAALDACAAQTASSPNNNPAVDAMVNVIAHELNEAVTDPHTDAWFDSYRDENADKCAWTFGATFLAANGSKANITLGGNNYLIQQNWVNLFGGYCAMNLTVPVLTSINPEIGSRGANMSVAINGFNLEGATISPLSGITISNVITSAQLVTATFVVDPVASLGARNLTLTTAAGTTNQLNFSVLPPAPVITTMNPASATPGQSITVTFTGFNLSNGSVNVGAGISLSNLNTTANQITVTFNIPSNAPSGPQLITVSTLGGTSNSLSFNVNSVVGPPTLYSINPSNGTQGSIVNVTITGTNFTTPASISMLDAFGITASNLTIVNSNLLTATLAIAPFAARRNSLRLQTPLGTSSSLNFDVLPGTPNQAPTLLSINPLSIGQGQGVVVTINGSNLTGASINPINGVTITSLGTNATQMSAMFTVAAGATLGSRSVTVTNLDGTSNALSLSITTAGPTLSSISPSSAAPGAAVPVTILGSGLAGGSINPMDGVTITNIVASATQITALFTLDAHAAVGSRNVIVSVGSVPTNAVTFTVTGSGPLLTSITPNSGRQGGILPVSMSGLNLAGASIIPMPGITISNVVSSATGITATFNISSSALTGLFNVSVNTATGTSNTLSFELKPIRDAR